MDLGSGGDVNAGEKLGQNCVFSTKAGASAVISESPDPQGKTYGEGGKSEFRPREWLVCN